MCKQADSCAIITSFAASHMRKSGQYSIYTKAGGKFPVACINKRFLCKCYTDLDMSEMKEHVTVSEKFSENVFDVCTTAKGLKKIRNSLSWPEKWIL